MSNSGAIKENKKLMMGISNVSLSFGGLKALIDVSLKIYEKEILSIF